MGRNSHLNDLIVTEDIGIFKVDGFVLDRVAGVDKNLSFSVEFDSVGGLVDSVGDDDIRLVLILLDDGLEVLLVHVADVTDGATTGVRQSQLSHSL